MITEKIAWMIVMIAIFFSAGIMMWFGYYLGGLCPFVGMAASDLEQWFNKRRRQ